MSSDKNEVTEGKIIEENGDFFFVRDPSGNQIQVACQNEYESDVDKHDFVVEVTAGEKQAMIDFINKHTKVKGLY